MFAVLTNEDSVCLSLSVSGDTIRDLEVCIAEGEGVNRAERRLNCKTYSCKTKAARRVRAVYAGTGAAATKLARTGARRARKAKRAIASRKWFKKGADETGWLG